MHAQIHAHRCVHVSVEVFAHGHVCVGRRERVVRCMHMGM